MSERLSVDHAADTIQFQRVDGGALRRQRASSPESYDTGPERLRTSASRAPSRRIVFKEKDGPNLWLITAIVALVAAVAVFIAGVVANQARDSTPTYQSVYVPEDVLGGSQR